MPSEARVARRILLAAAALAAVGCPSVWKGPPADHFDGTRFHSIEPVRHSISDWLRREATRRQRPWRDFTNTPPGARPPESVGDGRLRVTFVNHATVLVQMDGVNVLTDPIWAERALPITGPRRRRPPGLSFDELPPIDAVLVSHDHHDHMDLPTLRRLAAAHHPTVFAGLGTAGYLAGKGVPGGRDLDWWQSTEIAPGVSVTAVPARHSSGRGLLDTNRRLWCGFVLTGPSGSVFYAGDTGYGSHFARIAERFPRLRLALLPIGAYYPVWYMHPQHMSPADAVRASLDLGAGTNIPVHFGTFPQSDDGEMEPVSGLRAALVEAGQPGPSFDILDNGESADVPIALPGPVFETALCLKSE